MCPSDVENTENVPGSTNADSIVEDETKRFVNLLATFAAVKEVLLDILDDREQNTASLVGCSVLAVGAGYTSGKSS